MLQTHSVVSSGGTTLSASKPDSELIDLDLSGMTFEMWANFNKSSSSDGSSLMVPIMMLGQTNAEGTTSLSFQCDDTPWYDFAIYALDGSLEIGVPYDYDSSLAQCLDTSGTTIEFLTKQHIVSITHHIRC